MTTRRRSQILLVDDDASTIQLLGHMLAQEGEIRFTTSGTEALRMVDETPPDLILLDIDMPEKNGLEICRTLQANPRLAQVPVIILTSHAQAATEVWALEVGATDFIAKPLIASQVLARVRSQLRRLEGEASGEGARDPEAGPRGTRILIVDDDAGAIQCIRLALGTSADQFQFATSGEEALRAVAKTPPDLVLLDAQMPGIDGFEVCRRLQANPAFSHVPIVFVTRFSDPASEARAMDLGASDFIGKPYKPAVLKARVRNILRRKLQAHAVLKAQQVNTTQRERTEADTAHSQVDIRACVHEAVRLLQTHAMAAEVRLSCTQVEPVSARGDRALILQCLINLLSNGIKFNRPRGSVDVRIEALGQQVRITVSDTGVGMSPAQVLHLFEPVNGPSQGAGVHGAGIGLQVTRHLVRAMDGRIEVDSTAGEGSRFFISLPAWAPVTSTPVS